MATAALVVGLSAVPGASFLGVPGLILGIAAILLGLFVDEPEDAFTRGEPALQVLVPAG